jgi:hypothetical protein
VIGRFHAVGISSVREVANMEVPRRNDILKMDAQKMYVSVLHA